MFELTPDGLPFAQLGFVVLVGGRRLTVALSGATSSRRPPTTYRFFSPDRRMYILQAETLVAITVYWSLPAIFRGAAAIHFEDNTGALSHLVHGYASRPPTARGSSTLSTSWCRRSAATFGSSGYRRRPTAPTCSRAARWASRGRCSLTRLGTVATGEYEEVAFVVLAFNTLAAPLAQLDAQLAAGV